MIRLNFNFKLFPKPRGKLSKARVSSKTGKMIPARIYHSSKDYTDFQKTVDRAIIYQLGTKYQTISKPFYIGLFSSYIHPKRGRYPDLLDNELGGLLDCFVKSKLIIDDSRKYAIGDKILCYPSTVDMNVVLIGDIREMSEIDEIVNSLYYKAVIDGGLNLSL